MTHTKIKDLTSVHWMYWLEHSAE